MQESNCQSTLDITIAIVKFIPGTSHVGDIYFSCLQPDVGTITRCVDAECIFLILLLFFVIGKIHCLFIWTFPPKRPGSEPHTCNCTVWCKLTIGFLQEIFNLEKTLMSCELFGESQRKQPKIMNCHLKLWWCMCRQTGLRLK